MHPARVPGRELDPRAGRVARQPGGDRGGAAERAERVTVLDEHPRARGLGAAVPDVVDDRPADTGSTAVIAGERIDGTTKSGDGVDEQAEGGPGGWGRGWPGGAVEADDRVEVDDPSALVFGDLGVGQPHLSGERRVGEPGLAGEGAAQGNSEAPPQLGGAGVE